MMRKIGILALLVLVTQLVLRAQVTWVNTKLTPIPATATIVYHYQKFIYVMNTTGATRTQITFDNTHTYQHVAVSPGRRYIVANYDATNGQKHESKMVIYDLQLQRSAQLHSSWYMAGNGGVDWDQKGRIYFAGVQKLPFPNPTTLEQNQANEGAYDIWRSNSDGTGAQNLTNTIDKAEADVSVHESGNAFTYNAKRVADGIFELWVARNDVPQRAFTALDAVRTVHDPELSPDATTLVFSMRNPNFHNFPNDPDANTAQDIYRVGINGQGLTRITQPGPISILPDWKGSELLHMHMSDSTTPPWGGAIARNTSTFAEVRRYNNVNMPKFIP